MSAASLLRNRSQAFGGPQKLHVICHHVGHEKIDHGILLKSDRDFITHPNVFLVEVGPNKSDYENENAEVENIRFQVRLLGTEHRSHEKAVHLTIPEVVHLRNQSGSFAVLVDFDLTLDVERDPICGFIEAREEKEILFRVPLLIVPPKDGDHLRAMADDERVKSKTKFYIDEEWDGKERKLNNPNFWDVLEDAILMNAQFVTLSDSRILRLPTITESMISHALSAHQIGHHHEKHEFHRVRSAERLAEKEHKIHVSCQKCGQKAARIASICNFCQNVLKKIA
ncbi:unnamed protein product, partial [Mesorhabditis belari]|uniref:Uncharacterized protein n=1 Tax=Mesorhabditis belari TaxID=2138241 RepID=A0AAF3FAZ3_9BILA